MSTDRNLNRSSRKTNLKPYFVFGCISILIIIITLIINKDLSPDQQFYFKILFALGCAGVAAVIPGVANIKYKGTVSASGAIVVFILILNLNPPRQKFSFTIFPKSASGDIIDLSGSKITIQLNQGLLDGVSTSQSTIKFNDVPNEYYGESVNFMLGPGVWVFENGKRNLTKKLDTESFDLFLKKDPEFLIIGGTLYYLNVPLVGAIIEDADNKLFTKITDGKGNFKFNFSPNETRTRVRFTVTKNQVTFAPLEINMGNKSYETNFQ